MEKQGWLAPNNEILRVKDDESHQSKAKEITKKIGVKISQDKDIRLELINIGYVLYCESCIMALGDLNEEQKKIIKAELGTELPEVYLYKCKEDLGNEKEK